MSTKNCVRTIVAVGLIAWPSVETYRYFVAREQLQAALQRQDRVALRLAQAQHAQATKDRNAVPLTPASNPTSSQPKNSSSL
jgi:hypothetical protein